ncbi:MAG TPA: hypothetical protein VKU00_06410 [Chthonomonadaceae bacterium]|nr:hypothetical protein [Chthonomonadaceae bacterium]
MQRPMDIVPVDHELWILFSDVGTPIVTNGQHGKQRLFLPCENMDQAEELIEELQQERRLKEQTETTDFPTGPPAKGHRRLMYIERKAGQLIGAARIGYVTYSKSHRTIYYRGKAFHSLNGADFKSNYYDIATGEEYWISGCKRDGSDRLYGERIPVEIDEDARREYWITIRKQPENKRRKYSNMKRKTVS